MIYASTSKAHLSHDRTLGLRTLYKLFTLRGGPAKTRPIGCQIVSARNRTPISPGDLSKATTTKKTANIRYATSYLLFSTSFPYATQSIETDSKIIWRMWIISAHRINSLQFCFVWAITRLATTADRWSACLNDNRMKMYTLTWKQMIYPFTFGTSARTFFRISI